MNDTKIYYEDEQLKIIPFTMVFCGFMCITFLTFLRIKNPIGWAPYGFLVAMVFLIIWTACALFLNYKTSIKPKKDSLKKRAIILNKGIKTNGKIIDIKKRAKSYVDGKATSWYYFLNVEVNSKTIWTPAIAFNPKKLLSNDVTVYEYEGDYYVSDYKVSKNIVNENLNVEYIKDYDTYNDSTNTTIDKISDIYTNIMCIGGGIFFSGFIGWIIINSKEIYAIIMMIPFFVCGIGVLLKGLLPLLFSKSKYNLSNVGPIIYSTGAYSFYYGFLIYFDYNVIKEGQLSLFLFSLIFWGLGIYLIICKFKKE